MASPAIAEHSERYFKTGKGEYAEGDRFLGIRVPVVRLQAKLFRDLSLADTTQLLESGLHEERQCALFILVQQFDKGSDVHRNAIFKIYTGHSVFINNWDLVDGSAHQIIGAYLADKDKNLLYDFARSESLWQRRMSIISTYHYIKKNDFTDALKVSGVLVYDREDLIHKAVGWMLREIGKRDLAVGERFLQSRYKTMPRTMLRYSIEKFPASQRKRYLTGLV